MSKSIKAEGLPMENGAEASPLAELPAKSGSLLVDAVDVIGANAEALGWAGALFSAIKILAHADESHIGLIAELSSLGQYFADDRWDFAKQQEKAFLDISL